MTDPDNTLPARIRRSARVSGRFVLRSGMVSDTYFDKYQFESEPQLLLSIATELARLVPAGTEVLAGLEMGGVPIVTLLSQVTGLPAAFVRKCRYAEGASLAGKRFVLIEDVVSSGGALINSLAKLRADGLYPEAALCVIDRQTGGREALAKHGLALKALYTFDEIERA